MSKDKAPPYSAEFKERAVKLAIESDQPMAHTARDLGVNESTMHTWISKIMRGVLGMPDERVRNISMTNSNDCAKKTRY